MTYEEEQLAEAGWNRVRGLLGKRVRVVLHKPQPGNRDKAVITTGKLLGFGDGGYVEIEEDDGFVHYCWPMLEIEEAFPGD
jgi:hypothetical protein